MTEGSLVIMMFSLILCSHQRTALPQWANVLSSSTMVTFTMWRSQVSSKYIFPGRRLREMSGGLMWTHVGIQTRCNPMNCLEHATEGRGRVEILWQRMSFSSTFVRSVRGELTARSQIDDRKCEAKMVLYRGILRQLWYNYYYSRVNIRPV